MHGIAICNVYVAYYIYTVSEIVRKTAISDIKNDLHVWHILCFIL